ncbi:hypothetical protein [Acetanaerobacterium elongatum]|uniref:Uncharacterized protein n=1 Tax=Acetanaerobacterium elongatum TaxID=258515 RepID=A0A1G9W499_9FIRM|nr:hypothetical protein [Acetanaerobacterium elongatum]SDM79037.1 hypothetical protein SAMN05192585_10532 [Acetanaerobacterium elongatum]
MAHHNFVLLLVMVYTLLELLSIVLLARKRRLKYTAESVLVYAAFAIFLFFEYTGVFHTREFILIFVIATVVLHTLVGEALDIYHKSKVFDFWLHLLGVFSFAMFIYSIINNVLKPAALPGLYIAIYITALGTALGALFEIYEFVGDITSKSPLPSQHGLRDTDTDLIANTIGAILAGITSLFIAL